MPDIWAGLDFLARLDLYDEQRPYIMLLGEDDEVDDDIAITNLQFETMSNIHIQDMREHPELNLSLCGFEFLSHHQSTVPAFNNEDDIRLYKHETDALLLSHFNAIKVLTYEVKLRKNIHFDRTEYDVNDELVVEGPAKGAHNDVTYESGLRTIWDRLQPNDRAKYLQGGYRTRIVNTWRPLNGVLEDRPLALCDSRTVLSDDLKASDRVFPVPDKVGELYFLQHNPCQRWFWLERQKATEPFLFLTFDTMAGANMARFCPHVSFDNMRAPANAEARSSVETRSLVITTFEDCGEC